MLKKETILVTGVAGFIGFHLAMKLLKKGFPVIGIDNLNSYYDPILKNGRLIELISYSKESNVYFLFKELDICDFKSIRSIFNSTINNLNNNAPPHKIVHLAAQAGVRYSIENPFAYIQSNLNGFANILEISREFKIDHLVYASSSSVYGGNSKLPFSEKDMVDHPVSLYAATKKSNELMAHSYSHLYGIPATGLRFFTVYGPWGRPDMALFLFTKAIINNEPIKIFNKGNLVRDFTYIDDIIESLFRVIFKPAIKDKYFDTDNPNASTSWAPHRVFNIGNSSPIPLMDYINALEESLGKEAKKVYLSMQKGDVLSTYANTSLLNEWIDFKPKTPIKIGINNFVNWYKNFYQINLET